MLEDLRNSADEIEFDDFDADDDDIPIDLSFADETVEESSGSTWLGMSPSERAILAIFFFANVLIFGLALLAATGRLSL